MSHSLNLDAGEMASLKESFLNIVALFFKRDTIQTKYVGCLMKWSTQLNMSREDLNHIEESFDHLTFKALADEQEKLEAIFHLIHMIYIDSIVEDIELEVATIYAKELGFKESIVDELFSAIATAPYDGKSISEVKEEIAQFLNLKK